VAQLKRIFHMAGLNVRIGSISPDIKAPTVIDLPTGEQITLEPVIRSKRRLGLKDFDPCTILLNNDLSAGAPGILEDLHEQYLLPPLHAGWSVRRKSNHFKSYEEVSKRFGKLLGIDPWLINPMYNICGEVNFAEGTGMECLTTNVDALLTKIRKKYKEYGINEKPFVVVKADNGTYGMGIMTVRDVKDLDALNRKTKNKMSVIKDGQEVSQVIIQEGVLTNERMNDAVAEPVVYMMDRYVVGGFYRIHAERGVDENLNAPGASFVPLGVRREYALTPARHETGRQRAQPLLHVRRDRPAGHAGGQLRDGSHRPRRRNLRLTPPKRLAPPPRGRHRRPGVAGSAVHWNESAGPLLQCNKICARGSQAHNSGPKATEPRRRPRPATRGACVSASKSSLAALTLGAIGVVYGDIGTSVLYAVKEVFGSGHVPFTHANVYGVLSIFFWTLTVIVSIKYVVLVLRADNHGEGGLIAMLALASQAVKDKPALRKWLLGIGIFGTSLFYGDGVITPAISVLSAVEGLEVVSPAFKQYVIPLTLVILFGLFAVQKRGTGGIGKFFGPITLVWFMPCWRCWACRTSSPPGNPGWPSARTTRWASCSPTPAPPSSSWAPWCCA
jgi:glutamate--cysteine ligase